MNIFFDLDGTLTDPGEGIGRCIEYALDRLGCPCPDQAQLRRYIGPPLLGTFRELLAPLKQEVEAERAVALYRERFSEVGLYENRVYDGIPELLEVMRRSNCRMWIVTSKPTVFAVRIAEHFGLSAFFEAIRGAELGGRNTDKAELIAAVLEDTLPLRETPSWSATGATTSKVRERSASVVPGVQAGDTGSQVSCGPPVRIRFSRPHVTCRVGTRAPERHLCGRCS